jgi:hypothetical protein
MSDIMLEWTPNIASVYVSHDIDHQTLIRFDSVIIYRKMLSEARDTGAR